MNPELQGALAGKLLALADDELVLGQRDSEWCGHAPILEEDIAFANIALDEIGHAGLWYGLLADLLAEDRDTYPDQLVYTRKPEDFKNSQFVELPIGDWAFTIVRQYLFDAWETCQLEGLIRSKYKPIAEVAAKVQKEEVYHLRHSEAWVRRLGLGTEESNFRMQRALNSLWEYARQLFVPSSGETMLADFEFFPPIDEVEGKWLARVQPVFEAADLSPPHGMEQSSLERAQHTVHHRALILELQSVVRQYPGVSW